MDGHPVVLMLHVAKAPSKRCIYVAFAATSQQTLDIPKLYNLNHKSQNHCLQVLERSSTRTAGGCRWPPVFSLRLRACKGALPSDRFRGLGFRRGPGGLLFRLITRLVDTQAEGAIHSSDVPGP